jgi:hypothetical protein
LYYGDNYNVITGVNLSTATGSAATAGTHVIVASNGTAANYDIAHVNGVLDVSLRPVTITADSVSKVYGDNDPTLTYHVSSGSLAYGDLLAGSLTRLPGENVIGSPYAIQIGSIANSNYSLTFVGSNLYITPLSVSLTAEPKTKVYGDLDPSLTYISTPNVGSTLTNGETISYSGNLSRVPGENVGTYTINQGSLNNTNYNINYAAGQLTITPLSVSVTAEPKSKVYGDVDPAFTFISNPSVGSALANGELINYNGSLSRISGENIGTYAITQGSLTNTNYNITYSSSNLSITPLSVTVTASPKTKVYGSADPVLTFTSIPQSGSALANGELISFSGALSRAAGETVGTYSINQGNLANSNYNISFVGSGFTITPATVSTSIVVSPNPQQYSDIVTYSARIIGGAPLLSGGPQAAGSVTFKVGTQVIASNVALVISGADIQATYTAALLEPSPYGTAPTGQMAPGNHVVTAVINNPDNNYLFSTLQPTSSITITQENDPVYYTGGEFASTGSSTSTTAKIRLAASLSDFPDGNPGDIRNALVRFKIQPYNCDNAMTPQSIVYTSWRPVSLINSADITKGTAYLDTTFNIGSCDAKIYDITVEVGGYYSGYSDVVTISVAKSMNDFISGGGHLDFGSGSANQSSGVYKSSDNSKANWGFNVKYNKNKTNLQGNANIIIRNGGKVYQVKGIVGGSNGSLGVNVSDPANKKATLTAKANMIDLATGLPVSYGSNATLQLKMSDKGEPGANIDTYGFAIWGSNGALLYSSNWSGSTNSTNEVAINGGNIQIGSTVAGARFQAPDSSGIDSVHVKGSNLQNGPYIVKIFPNPTNEGKITVNITGTDERLQPVELYISDINGRLIYSDEQFCLQNCTETTLNLDRRYKAGIYLIDIIMDGKVFHQKLVVQ